MRHPTFSVEDPSHRSRIVSVSRPWTMSYGDGDLIWGFVGHLLDVPCYVVLAGPPSCPFTKGAWELG